MLLELARWLQGFARFFALFDYLTMRAILGALTALADVARMETNMAHLCVWPC